MFFGCLKTWIHLTKDHVIPYLPNRLAHQHYYLHEKWDLQLIFEVLEILERVSIVVHLNVNPRPTLRGKRAFQEKLGQRFFNRAIAQDTVVVLEHHVFPFEQLPSA